MENDYYKTPSSVKEYISLSAEVSGKDIIKKLEDYLPKRCKILELGSGPGTDWRILNDKYEVVGSDFSEEFLKHLKKENNEGRFIELNASTLKTDEKFGAIYSNKVLQHLTEDEIKQSFDRQIQLLPENGWICHSFWKGEGTEIFKGMYVKYHTKDSISKLCADKFEIILLEAYAEFEEGDSIVLIARKK